MAAPAVSILKRATSQDVRTEPFPHTYVENALPRDYYRRLASSFPLERLMGEAQNLGQNKPYFHSAVHALTAPADYPPEWVSFVRYHTSDAFFRDIIKLFAGHFRATHPTFEQRVGKALEDMTVGPRVPSATWDLRLDCQFVINTPVTESTSVRGPHIDKKTKLFNALLYMRRDEDESTGGEFELHTLRSPPTWGARGDQYAVSDDVVESAKVLPYRANSLVLFLNSPTSLHGVTPRSVTQVPRQFINFLVECSTPVFSHAYAG